MEKEFVPYELDLELKKLGFDEECFAFYNTTQMLIVSEFLWKNSFSKDSSIVAPLFQRAFRWFREKYGIVHTVYSNASGYIWELHYDKERGGTHIFDSGESGDCEMSGMFTSYEKAELECLKQLIKIAKNEPK